MESPYMSLETNVESRMARTVRCADSIRLDIVMG